MEEHLTLFICVYYPRCSAAKLDDNAKNVLCDSCRFGDHYEWNKVTSCIHNILSGQRWIEHYGEMSIKNINSNDCQCKITFVKVRKSRCLNPWVSF